MTSVSNNKLTEQDILAIKNKLVDQREDLMKTIEKKKGKLLELELSNPDRSTLAKSFVQREHIETIIGDAEYQWTKIEQAFDRFEKGTYGKCSNCGSNINVDRLKVIPAADHCVQCQEKMEKVNS